VNLYIAGAGGFGRETYDAVLACGEVAAAFLDDALAGRQVRGLPVLRPDEAPAGAGFVVGVADPAARRRLAGLLGDRGLTARTVIHPRAVVGPDTHLGPGSVVLANAHVSSSVRLGSHVQVNYNATVGHDTIMEAYVTVYPGANVGGTTHLEEGVTIGSNACVLQGLRVGKGTVIGAGAVVTKDLPGGVVVAGVPARELRHGASSDHE
jgi:sugar O-acyltransferase (sialic acid O-acetyltransferase NeuD family)